MKVAYLTLGLANRLHQFGNGMEGLGQASCWEEHETALAVFALRPTNPPQFSLPPACLGNEDFPSLMS